MNNLDNILFIIPSLDPDDKMPEYVRNLIKEGAKHVLLVDDGSKNEYKHYFEELKDLKEVTILTHEVNKGKGRALKTAFDYVLNNMKDIKAVVTADADGQHAPDDTINTGLKTIETNDVVFGTRNFNEEIVPFKSRNGNKITTTVFKLLYGKQVNDTQTGLRGLPVDFLPKCLEIKGERFEYEIGMLIEIVKENRNIYELPIKTIYFDSNRATHFDTFKDSFRIYKIMFSQFIKFVFISASSFLIDIALYTALYNLIFVNINYSKAILYSTVLARVVSSLYNFIMNKNKVFESNGKTSKTIAKYYLLAVCQMLVSSFLVSFVFSKIKFNTSIIKLFVDFVLFLISYQIQRKWVFKE